MNGKYENITGLLASLNPHWSISELRALFGEHFGVFADEARQLSRRQPGHTDLRRGSLLTEEIADYMARGIIRQFGIE